MNLMQKFRALVRRNRDEWGNMDDKAKRVAVAKDVLAQLDAKRITAAHGVYVAARSRVLPNAELAALKSCDACALGSTLMALVNYEPEGETALYNTCDAMGIHARLRRLFSQRQLELIEGAFENGSDKCLLHPGDQTRVFGYEVSAETRLRRIMENIVRNDGCFIPSDPMMAKTP